MPALDKYNIDPSSINVTNCESWESQELIDKNAIVQTTVYVTKANGNVVITASAIGLGDSYNVNILTQPTNTTILTSYTEDTNLSKTTTFTGSIYEEKKIYIYLPWKYIWRSVDIHTNDENKENVTNSSITDQVEVTIDGTQYTKAILTITYVENYQTPDIEILITVEEKPLYNITFKDIDDVVNWDNPITSAYDGQKITIKPIILDEYYLSQISIVEQSGTTIWNTDEDINAAINGEKTIKITGDTIISASYDITFSWNNLENYIIGEDLSSMSSSGSVTRNYEVTKGGHYFFAQANDGYEFSDNTSITVSNPDAE